MPALTRTAVRTRIRELLAEPTARHFPDTSINTWIDDGVRDVSIKTFCQTKIVTTGISTTSGVATYAWPTDMGTTSVATLGIKSIVTSSNVSLDYITPEQIGRAIGTTFEDMKWTCWQDTIVLSPVPTATYTLTPYIWVEARQTAAGSINLPNPYHHLVTFYGVFMGHMKRLELDAAQFFYEYYQREMNHVLSLVRQDYLIHPMKQGVHDQGETP